VTGCGKTEVYLQAAEKTLQEGRDVLVLVPEIALATQLESHFLSRFGEQVVLLHSGLTAAERFDQYALALGGQARIVIGARSAVFAPLRRLGLIIVDEEHDPGFKQDEGFCYHGRDLAVLRASLQRCAVILGSATPSITSYAHGKSGKYRLLSMQERVFDRSMPTVTVVDLRRQENKGDQGLISPPLLDRLHDTLSRGKQSILLINRRGFAAASLCRDCGTPVQCNHCHVALTWHKGRNRLICHYCGFSLTTATLCDNCRGSDLAPAGFGTERIEDEIRQLLPGARLARLDSDSALDRRGFFATLAAMHQGQIDVLIGTQMIAKGHHFPGVTLVGVVWADGGMSMPDFRAAERTFQLLTQVTGRAGRGETPGEVIIQTLRPDHYSIVYATRHDYEGMFCHEVRLRKHPRFPPFVRLAVVRVKGRVERMVQESCAAMARFLRQQMAVEKLAVEILGPAPAPLDKIRDHYRWQLLLKTGDSETLKRLGSALRTSRASLLGAGCEFSVDVDPENMM
jgi:primosomal protein N' (replication factor Y) (superfamily II helicase)